MLDRSRLLVCSATGATYEIGDKRFVIGRAPHCDLVIPSRKVSPQHAAIMRVGSDFVIQDLGSTNGTWLNKQRVKRSIIEDGQEYFLCSERIMTTFPTQVPGSH
jgi:pSer/pThr/pTyr-binding forkhead associated (FHA) protein